MQLAALGRQLRGRLSLLCCTTVLALFPPAFGTGETPGAPLTVSAYASLDDLLPGQLKDPPTPPEGTSAQLVGQAEQDAWEAAGEASEARTSVSVARMDVASAEATKAAKETEERSSKNQAEGPKAVEAEQRAKSFLGKALAWEKKTKALQAHVAEESYRAAREAAEAEYAKLSKEGDEYFQSLMANLEALKNQPAGDAKTKAAAAAAEPYFKVALTTEQLVMAYNTKANELVSIAAGQVGLAHKLANQAVVEQSQGMVDMAQRNMIQAHGLVGDANMKEAQAKSLRKLAESLNRSIPNYQNAAMQAAIHVMATFSGVQLGSRVRSQGHHGAAGQGRQPPKADLATLHQAEALGAQVDAALAKLSASLAALRL